MKKLSNYERDNKELLEKLHEVEEEKRNVSLKWQKASAKLKQDDKLKLKIKELEQQLVEKTQEQ